MNRFVVAAAIAAGIGAVSAAAAAPPVSATIVNDDRLPPASVMLGDVRVHTDVVYGQPMGFRPLRLDVYQPAAATPRPLVLFVHGGSWIKGHKRATAHFADFPGLLADLARRGFVVVSVEYRLGGEAAFPGASDDVKAALAYMRANAGRFGVDPQRVALWGASAGAHVAAMAAFTDTGVQAYLGWYGPYDIDALIARQLAALNAGVPIDAGVMADMDGGLAFFGCTRKGCPPGAARAASPIAHVDAKDPPALLVHGTADAVVPFAQSEAFASTLRSAGVPVELVRIEAADHSWTSATPAATTAASQRAAQVSFDWLQSIFAKK